MSTLALLSDEQRLRLRAERRRIEAGDRRTITIAEATRTYSLSRIHLWRLLKAQKIKGTRSGRRRLIVVASLEEHLGLEP
jgi:excisionase family DNA binding protein